MSEAASPTPTSDLASFRAQLDLLDIAEKLTEVKRSGPGMGKILCPEHADTNPSCQVYPDHYFCFVCKAHGDVFRLVMLLRNLTFSEALDWISEETGIVRPTRDPATEAQAAAVKIFRTHVSDALEALPDDVDLPGGITAEVARRLGIGFGAGLEAVVAASPKRLLTPDETAAWEGGFTIELHGRGGLLGFGALLPAEPVPATIAPVLEPDDAEDELDEEEPYEVVPDYDDGGAAEEPDVPQPPVRPAAATASAEPSLRFVRASALRLPAFAGLSVARESISRQKAVAVSPDLATFIELQAAGYTGIVAPSGPIDAQTATSVAALAPRVIVVVGPAFRHRPTFMSELLALAGTGARIELVPLIDGALGTRMSLFEYLAEAARRLHVAERDGEIAALLGPYLGALPSRSTRRLYEIELEDRGLRPGR